MARNQRVQSFGKWAAVPFSVGLILAAVACISGPAGAPGSEGPRGDKGDRGDKGEPGPVIVATADGGFDIGPLIADVAQLKARVATLEAVDCPPGYARDASATSFIVCTKDLGSGMVDEIVRVGDFWADRYEISSCAGDLGPAQGHSVVNGSPFTTATACSRKGVMPQTSITWFQAAQMCANAGKHLCTNAEWQVAVNGTKDPGSSTGAGGTCVTNGSIRATGNGTACVSRFGCEEMIGNAYEWVADWQGAMGNEAEVAATSDYGADGTYGGLAAPTGGGNGFLAALARGGGPANGLRSGAFGLNANFAPSYQNAAIGARCCLHRR